MNNQQSTFRVGKNLIAALEKDRPAHVLLVFGNVDLYIDFVYQLQTQGTRALNPDAFQTHVFEQYTGFIKEKILGKMIRENDNKGLGYIKKLLISSVIMPVVEDGFLELSLRKYTEIQKKYNNSAPEAIVTVADLLKNNRGCDLESRRDMVAGFNKRLEEWCTEHNVSYVDINPSIKDPECRAVRKECIDANDPTNFHILWEPTIGFWIEQIRAHGITGVDLSNIKDDLERSAHGYSEEKRQRMERNSVTSVLLKHPRHPS